MNLATDSPDSLICSCQTMQRIPARAVGCFKLQPRHALTLTIRASGDLHIAHGRVWLTFANAAQDATVRAGDHFLQAGEVLRLDCGQQVVIQTLDAGPDSSVYFSWAPDAASGKVAFAERAKNIRCDVQQPVRDLGRALHQAVGALGRLAQGVAGYLACTLMRCNTAAR